VVAGLLRADLLRVPVLGLLLGLVHLIADGLGERRAHVVRLALDVQLGVDLGRR
jgi:hypothetical protein